MQVDSPAAGQDCTISEAGVISFVGKNDDCTLVSTKWCEVKMSGTDTTSTTDSSSSTSKNSSSTTTASIVEYIAFIALAALLVLVVIYMVYTRRSCGSLLSVFTPQKPLVTRQDVETELGERHGQTSSEEEGDDVELLGGRLKEERKEERKEEKKDKPKKAKAKSAKPKAKQGSDDSWNEWDPMEGSAVELPERRSKQ